MDKKKNEDSEKVTKRGIFYGVVWLEEWMKIEMRNKSKSLSFYILRHMADIFWEKHHKNTSLDKQQPL